MIMCAVHSFENHVFVLVDPCQVIVSETMPGECKTGDACSFHPSLQRPRPQSPPGHHAPNCGHGGPCSDAGPCQEPFGCSRPWPLSSTSQAHSGCGSSSLIHAVVSACGGGCYVSSVENSCKAGCCKQRHSCPPHHSTPFTGSS